MEAAATATEAAATEAAVTATEAAATEAAATATEAAATEAAATEAAARAAEGAVTATEAAATEAAATEAAARAAEGAVTATEAAATEAAATQEGKMAAAPEAPTGASGRSGAQPMSAPTHPHRHRRSPCRRRRILRCLRDRHEWCRSRFHLPRAGRVVHGRLWTRRGVGEGTIPCCMPLTDEVHIKASAAEDHVVTAAAVEIHIVPISAVHHVVSIATCHRMCSRARQESRATGGGGLVLCRVENAPKRPWSSPFPPKMVSEPS